MCRSFVKSASIATLKKELLVGFDALQQLMVALESVLGHVAVFCCDCYGGEVIGVKWRPQAFLAAPFRVATAHTSILLEVSNARGVCVPDMCAILEEIVDIGKGMVADVMIC